MNELVPLSARSVVLSLLLGAHPRGMGPGQLARAGEHVGIAAATVRVALTRAVAAGDLQRFGPDYHLGPRLLARRRRHELATAVVAWDGSWETVVVVGPGRPSTERGALRVALAAGRLAELREGVWLRPANLRRPLPDTGTATVQVLRSRPDGDPAALAGTLWDLPGWAVRAVATLDALASTTDPAARLAVAAQLVRHLGEDPLLPSELCPPGWPAARARQVYAAYEQEITALGAG